MRVYRQYDNQDDFSEDITEPYMNHTSFNQTTPIHTLSYPQQTHMDMTQYGVSSLTPIRKTQEQTVSPSVAPMPTFNSEAPPLETSCSTIVNHVKECKCCSKVYSKDYNLYIIAMIGILLGVYLLTKALGRDRE